MLSDSDVGMLLIRYLHSCTKMEPFLGGKEEGRDTRLGTIIPKVFNWLNLEGGKVKKKSEVCRVGQECGCLISLYGFSLKNYC